MADQCLQFNDVFEVPSGSDEDQKNATKRNERNDKLYRAVRYVLKTNFDLKDNIPEDPKSFATAQLPDTDRAQFIGILGLIQADNWTDPSNGKIKQSPDDLFYRGATLETSFVIDRRFVDAVVEAVKEYTASSKLFNNIYKLMRDEAVAGFDKKSHAHSSSGFTTSPLA
jgi:hypothetical protein